VKAIDGDGVLVQHRDGRERIISADRVVLARGVAPANELAQEIEALHPLVVGDAAQPGKIIDAIAEGFRSARSI
jgi:hypothetical protein